LTVVWWGKKESLAIILIGAESMTRILKERLDLPDDAEVLFTHSDTEHPGLTQVVMKGTGKGFVHVSTGSQVPWLNPDEIFRPKEGV
jgi:hypothetical protein